MRGHESVCLRRDGGEDALLMKSDAVRTAPIRRRVKAMAPDLVWNQFASPSSPTGGSLTFRLRQYLHAMAVRCLGAG